ANGSQTFTLGAAVVAGFTLYNAGETPTITATADTKSGTTAAITVNPAAKNKLLWAVYPAASVTAGATWVTFTVEITDQYGNRTSDTDDVTITPSTGSFVGTTTKAAVNGLASFTDIIYLTAAVITVSGSSGGLTPTSASNPVTVNAPAPAVITWTGAVSTGWNIPGNWDLNRVPGSGDTVIIAGAANQPVFSGDVTLGNLTINSGDSLSTGGYALTVNNNITLGGTLNAAASAITAGGSVTSAGGTLEGTSPNLSAGGNIGALGNPLNVSITGTLSIHAGGMQDMVSISLTGTGSYSFYGSIPGFALVNGKPAMNVGQAAFAASLRQGEGPLYKEIGSVPFGDSPYFQAMGGIGAFGAAPAIMMVAPGIAMPAVAPVAPIVPAALPAPAPAVPVTPAPLPAIPPVSFTGASGASSFVPEISFFGTSASSAMPGQLPPVSFEGTISRIHLSVPCAFPGANASSSISPAVSFEGIGGGIVAQSELAPENFGGSSSGFGYYGAVVTPGAFEGAGARLVLPEKLPPGAFDGADGRQFIPERITIENFAGIQAVGFLPGPYFENVSAGAMFAVKGGVRSFKEVTGAANIYLEFPGGRKIMPTYGVGIPLGAERPLLEPKIKANEERH
ncbi:MAG: hypothetical protein V1927_05115, partial [Candidatus Omnitrophota bacterium]